MIDLIVIGVMFTGYVKFMLLRRLGDFIVDLQSVLKYFGIFYSLFLIVGVRSDIIFKTRGGI